MARRRVVEEISAVHAVTRELRSLGLRFRIVEDMGNLSVGAGMTLPELGDRGRRAASGRLTEDIRAFERHFFAFSGGDAAFWGGVLAEAKALVSPAR